ncbi:hypothetical protein JCM17960_25410 [Magnetospira thiophila]
MGRSDIAEPQPPLPPSQPAPSPEPSTAEGYPARQPEKGDGVIVDPQTPPLEEGIVDNPAPEMAAEDTVFTYDPIDPVEIKEAGDLPPKTLAGYENAKDVRVRDAIFEQALKGRTGDGEKLGKTHVQASGGVDAARQTMENIVRAGGGRVEDIEPTKDGRHEYTFNRLRKNSSL